MAITVSLPYTPLAPIIGFVPLPASLLSMLALIVVMYLASAEITKHVFYRYNRL